MKRREGAYARNVGKVNTRSDVIREFFRLLDEDRCFVHDTSGSTVYNWRSGRAAPTLFKFEEICKKHGYEITLVRVEGFERRVQLTHEESRDRYNAKRREQYAARKRKRAVLGAS